MNEIIQGPWWVVVTAALPSVASAVWVIYRWWADRDDRRADKLLTRDERRAKELDDQQKGLTTQQSEMFKRVSEELARIEIRLEVVQRDRDRGWDLARYWHRLCHDMHRRARDYRHDLIEARTVVSSTYQRFAPNEIQDITPIEPMQSIPLGLEDPK